MESFLLESPTPYRVLMAVFGLVLPVLALLLLQQGHEKRDWQWAWKVASLVLVSVLLIPAGLELSWKAHTIAFTGESVTLEFVGPRTQQELSSDEIRSLVIARRYTLDSKEKVTGSNWFFSFHTNSSRLDTLATDSLGKVLDIRESLTTHLGMRPDYQCTFGRLFEPTPCSREEALSEVPLVNRLPAHLTPPPLYRITRIWRWIPF